MNLRQCGSCIGKYSEIVSLAALDIFKAITRKLFDILQLSGEMIPLSADSIENIKN